MPKNDALKRLIGEIKIKNEINQEQIANILEINKSYLSDMISGRVPVTENIQLKIYDKFHILYEEYVLPQKQNTNNDKHYAFQKIFEKINHNIISNDDVFKMAINKINDEYDAALLALITELLDRIEKQITELNKKQEQIDRLINVIDKLTNNMITNEIETIKKDI